MKTDLMNFFQNIPELETPRLLLRKISVSDTDDMFEYACAPITTKYLLWSPHESKRATESYLRFLQVQYKKKNYYDWAITLKATGKMIGTCGFSSFDETNNSGEIGYVVNHSYWGHGYAPEAVNAVTRLAFSKLRLNRMSARIIDGNAQSCRVMEKCGYVYEGTLRSYMLIKGIYRDIRIYSRLASDKTDLGGNIN